MALSATAEQTGPDFIASLKYLRRDAKYDHEKPFSCLIGLSIVPGAEQTNIVIMDGRKHSPEFDLDKTGFELIDIGDFHQARNFEDTEWLRKVYYPFVEEMVLQKLGAKEAHASSIK